MPIRRKKIPLPNATYEGLSEEVLPEFLGTMHNCYKDELGYYHDAPGTLLFCDLNASGALQGKFWWKEKNCVIAVAGGRIYRIEQDRTFSDVTGDALHISNRVSFDTDGSTLVMANGGKMVTYTGTGTTAYMADPDAPTAVDTVAYLDGRLLANVSGTEKWQYSSATDITAWAAADFYSAQTQPDELLALFVRKRRIALFGENTIEFWYNDGINPFSRDDLNFIERGCSARDSICYAGGDLNTYIWLDHERRVSMIKNGVPQTVSPPVDDVIRDLYPITDAHGFVINLGTRMFYVLTFPAANLSLALDLSTERWYRWGKWNAAAYRTDKLWYATYVYARGWEKHLVGDAANGKVYQLSEDYHTFAGDEIRTVIETAPVIHGGYNTKVCHGVDFRFKRGVGSEAGDEPKVMVQWKDENRDWSPEVSLSLGKQGEGYIFAHLRRCGQYKARQWRIIHTDDSDFVLASVEEQVEFLNN